MSRAALSIAVSFLVLIISAVPSRAGNNRSYFLGNEAALTAGAGVAVTRDGGAIWYNPAGLAAMEAGKFEISGTAYTMQILKYSPLLSATLPSGKHDFDASSMQLFAVPTAVLMAYRLSPSLCFGVGFFVTGTEYVDVNHNFASRENVPQLTDVVYQQGLNSSYRFTQYRVAAALGWKVTPKFRMGFTFLGIYETHQYSLNFFSRLSGNSNGQAFNAFTDVSQQVTVYLVGMMATMGAQWEFLPRWHLGLVIRSPAFSIRSWGELLWISSMVAPDDNGYLTSSQEHILQSLDKWQFEMTEPLKISLAVGYRGAHWWIGLETGLAMPMTNDSLSLSYEVTWNVSLGARFRLSDTIWAGAGFFTDHAPQKKVKDLSDQLINYYGFTLGLTWKKPFTVVSKSKKRKLVFSTTIGLRYTFGIGEYAGLHFDLMSDTATGVVVGDTSYHELLIHLGSALRF